MKYTGKYLKMAEQFRRDGADEYMIEKFIRQEMEQDEFPKGEGTTNLEAYKIWKSWPEERRQMYLHNAFCARCGGVASFADSYNIRRDSWGLIVEGTCVKCGGRIRRVCD